MKTSRLWVQWLSPANQEHVKTYSVRFGLSHSASGIWRPYVLRSGPLTGYPSFKGSPISVGAWFVRALPLSEHHILDILEGFYGMSLPAISQTPTKAHETPMKPAQSFNAVFQIPGTGPLHIRGVIVQPALDVGRAPTSVRESRDPA
jgi:hypothetical protein